jgi:hypothetical protein
VYGRGNGYVPCRERRNLAVPPLHVCGVVTFRRPKGRAA